MPGMAQTHTFAGSGSEAPALLFSSGIGDMSASPLCLSTDSHVATFGYIRGEEQPAVRWKPAAWGCNAWPAREKKEVSAQEKKQGGIGH